MNETQPESPAPRATPPTSKLAITALVLGVLPGCPLINLVGALFALAALRRIRAAPHLVGGRRLAIVALIVGWTFALLWTGIWTWATSTVQRGVEETMVAVVENVIRDDSPDRATAQAGFLSGQGTTAPSPEVLRAFGDEVSRRYGALERVSITSMNTDSAFNPVYSAALVLYFRERTQPASARFIMPVGSMQMRLLKLVIIDAKEGNLEVPGPSLAEAAPTTQEAP